MMEKKNIDRLFQEKFRDFEAAPPEYVWDRIEEELEKKKKRRVIPIWWTLSRVAAILLIGFAVWMAWQMWPSGETRVVSTPEKQAQPVEMAPGATGSPVIPAPGSLIEGVAGSGKDVKEEAGSQHDQRRTGELNGIDNRLASDEVTGSNDTNDTNEKSSSAQKSVRNKTVKGKLIPAINRSAVASSEQTEQNRGRSKDQNKIEPNFQSTEGIKNVITKGTPGNEIQVAVTESNKKISPDNQAGPERILSVQEPEKAIAVQDASVKKDSAVVAAAEPNALEELLKEKEKENTVTSDAKLNRWQITSNVAPIYFSSASNGSPIDSRLEGANKSYKTSVSYGAGVQYALNKRFSVRSGVNALALEYSTTDIFFFQTPNARQLRNVNSNLQGSLIQVETNPGMVALSTTGRADKRYDGMLNQRIGYIEVPVEMSYQIIQKRLGVAVIGGFSTLFLNQNDVSLEGTGLNMTIGEASNLNPMHFSTNVGLGIKYDILKSLQVKVEPIVKYQLNTFSNDSGNFKPFFLGVYTGLNYRF